MFDIARIFISVFSPFNLSVINREDRRWDCDGVLVTGISFYAVAPLLFGGYEVPHFSSHKEPTI